MKTATMNSQETIERILAAARRPCPAITEAIRFVDPATGQRYLWNGVPYGVDSSKLVRTVIGYVYTDGTCTYGTCHPSRRDAEQSHNENQDKQASDFREKLEAMSAKRFAEQVAYWLK
jgi:hypothetical protein